MMIAQEFDRAAARLAEENAALEALFADAAHVVGDADAARRAARRRRRPRPVLLVSALHERNRVLRALLVRLHAHVESLDRRRRARARGAHLGRAGRVDPAPPARSGDRRDGVA